MADFIQGAGGQEIVNPSPSEFLSPDQGAQIAGTALNTQGEPQAPAGAPMGAGMNATQQDPLNAPPEEASPEEQKQYQDLFLRAVAAVNDTKVAPKAPRSLADEVIKLLSTKGKEAYISIGTTAGLIMTQLIDTAKRQGVEYEGSVVMEVGLDLIHELAGIARMSGAIDNLPEEDTPEYDKLMELSALEAAKYFGEYQLATGQADQVGHRKELDEQMQREADAGQLDNWGMEEMDPEIRGSLAQQMGAGGQQNGPELA
jgi:hypothetical protein